MDRFCDKITPRNPLDKIRVVHNGQSAWMGVSEYISLSRHVNVHVSVPDNLEMVCVIRITKKPVACEYFSEISSRTKRANIAHTHQFLFFLCTHTHTHVHRDGFFTVILPCTLSFV